ncbi:MAG: hypothetical protein WCB49_08900 [Gammaproteobacteria bacterium]
MENRAGPYQPLKNSHSTINFRKTVMTDAFKDHFSGHAESCAATRPDYPAKLFAWLAGQAPAQELAQTCDQVLDLCTWSAVQRYRRGVGRNPMTLVADAIDRLWGDATRRRVCWSLYLRARHPA